MSRPIGGTAQEWNDYFINNLFKRSEFLDELKECLDLNLIPTNNNLYLNPNTNKFDLTKEQYYFLISMIGGTESIDKDFTESQPEPPANSGGGRIDE